MKQITNFTFKTEKPTGKWKAFDNQTHIIKYGKSNVGMIHHAEPFTVRLQIIKADKNEDGCPNCPWKWITLKGDHKSLQEAKDWVNQHFKAINEKYKLHID